MEKEQIKRTHYFKVFIIDDGYVINDDGAVVVHGDRNKTISDIGESIISELDKTFEAEDGACYGYRIDYKLSPIYKDPFK